MVEERIIGKILEIKKAPGTTPGLKPNPLEPTHPFPMTWEGITILKPIT
jgi:hypothetical protein